MCDKFANSQSVWVCVFCLKFLKKKQNPLIVFIKRCFSNRFSLEISYAYCKKIIKMIIILVGTSYRIHR